MSWRQEQWSSTAGRGQAGRTADRTGGTGQIGQSNRAGTTMAGQSGYGILDRTTKTGQPEQVNLDETEWTGEPGHYR
jgi:hypothetical protein